MLVLAATTPPWWYLTRMFAVSSYVTLTALVALGILQAYSRVGRQPWHWALTELHPFLGLLTGALVFGHLYTLKMDTFIGFSFGNFFIPGAQPYSPLATNIGVFAFYTMAIVLGSSWLKKRIPYSLWRTIHYISFPVFILVTLHGFLGGSDKSEGWLRAIYGAATAMIAFLTLVRWLNPAPAVSQQS